MPKVLIEVMESLRVKKLLTVLVIVQLVVCFTLLLIVSSHFQMIEMKGKSFLGQYENQNIYQLSDNLFGAVEAQFLASESGLGYMKDFYSRLQNHEEFTYISIIDQPIGIHNFVGNEKFVAGYTTGMLSEPYENLGKEFTPVEALRVDESVFSLFGIQLAEGEYFQPEHFFYQDGDTIPVILGSGYLSVYQIGDQLDIDFLFKEMTAEVIGIMEPNTIIPVHKDFEFYADNHMIFPCFSIINKPTNDIDKGFQQRHYLQAVNGDIYTNKNPIEVRQTVDDIGEEAGFTNFQIVGANTIGIDFLSSMTEENSSLFLFLTIFFFVFAIICNGLLLLMKWNLHVRKYVIHLTSGGLIKDVFVYLAAEIIAVLIISIVITIILSKFIGILPVAFYYLLFGASALIGILSTLPLYIHLKKVNLSKVIKEKM